MEKLIDFKIRLDSDKIDLLFVATLSLNLVTSSINHVVNIFAPGSPLDTLVCYALYCCILIIALPSVLKRISIYCVVVLFIGLLLFAFAYIQSDTYVYAVRYSKTFFLQMIPLFVLGATINDLDHIDKLMEKVLPIITVVCVCAFVSDRIRGQSFREDDMAYAYWMLPFTVYSIISFIKKPKSIFYIFISIVLLICQMLTGTRGPLLCIISALLLYVLFSEFKKGGKILIIFLGIGLFLWISSDYFIPSITYLANQLSIFGINNRILLKLQSGEFFEGSNREVIYSDIWRAIKEQPLYGYGFLGDRNHTSSHTYPHNLVLEILCQYGCVFGGCLLILLFVMVWKFMKMNRKNTLAIMLVSCSVVKLFISGTYITEELFFVLLGVMCNKHIYTSIVSNSIFPRNN